MSAPKDPFAGLRDIREGAAGGFFNILRALAGAFTVWFILHQGVSPVVAFVLGTFASQMAVPWGLVEIALSVVLVVHAIVDGFSRSTHAGLYGVGRAIVEQAGSLVAGLIGGGLSIFAFELVLFLVFGFSFGWNWSRITTDPGLTAVLRLAAPAAFFFGTWTIARATHSRLVS